MKEILTLSQFKQYAMILSSLKRILNDIDSNIISNKVLKKYHNMEYDSLMMPSMFDDLLKANPKFEPQVDEIIIKTTYHQMLDLLNKINPQKYSLNSYVPIRSDIVSEYIKTQKELLSYDLSMIDASEWRYIDLYTKNNIKINFSNTNANIDFDFFNYDNNICLKKCNIKNMNRILRRVLNKDNFDDEIVSHESKYFITDFNNKKIEKKIYNCEFTISDLVSLSDEQFDIIKDKYILNNFCNKDKIIVKTLGIEKTRELYLHYKDDYDIIATLILGFVYGSDDCGIISLYNTNMDNIEDEISHTELEDIKGYLTGIFRDAFLSTRFSLSNIDLLPQQFKNENKDIFLLDSNISDELKDKFFEKNLTIKEYLDNKDIFKKFPIEYFTECFKTRITEYNKLKKIFGEEGFQLLIENHSNRLEYISKVGNLGKFTSFCLNNITDNYTNTKNEIDSIITNFFNNNNSISEMPQLMQYTPDLFKLKYTQKLVIDTLGLDNIKKFQNETGFLSSLSSSFKLPVLFECFLQYLEEEDLIKSNKKLSYKEFTDLFAKMIDTLRADGKLALKSIFYNWYQGPFRKEHPEIFIDNRVPSLLGHYFERGRIPYTSLIENQKFLKYFYDKNLYNVIKEKMYLVKENGGTTNFIEEFTKRYGNYRFLRLILDYGIKDLLDDIQIDNSNDEIDDYDSIMKSFRKAIYDKIDKYPYSFNYKRLEDIKEFREEYSDIFIDLDKIDPKDRDSISYYVYESKLPFSAIQKYPELKEQLKDKKLSLFFNYSSIPKITNSFLYHFNLARDESLNLIDVVGNEKFLELCNRYGDYIMGRAFFSLTDDFDDICKVIEKDIYNLCRDGQMKYDPVTAPEFLKKKHPELFLSEDIPEMLKDVFYSKNEFVKFDPYLINENKDWIPYFEGKDVAVKAALLRNTHRPDLLQSYFDIFENDALKLLYYRPDTVSNMISNNEITLLKKWYDKTGKKFIPDYVVMQNFDENEIDKFLVSGSNWSKLMKIDEYSSKEESRDGMLKLAYAFGVFDNDNKGMKCLVDLLTGLPRKIDSSFKEDIETLDNSIFGIFYEKTFLDKIINIDNEEEKYKETIKYLKKCGNMTLGDDSFHSEYFDKGELINKFRDLLEFFQVLKSEGVELSFSKSIIQHFYRKNEDGSYRLSINPQSYPKTTKKIRDILSKIRPSYVIITPTLIHNIASGFSMKYDPDFREFFLNNINTILTDPNTISYISKIQQQFHMIKVLNSNRNLTLDRAIEYVKSNRFDNVEVGNANAATILAQAGYSQEDFDILQEIYNYGKQRTFSSIPRIKDTYGKYTYEMLRLDDPLAMAIGTLTDCCQELNNAAEVCMEHSMVSSNGRIFVVRDSENRLIAQSWVWRRKDTLCFDNIEIPNKVFDRARRAGIKEEEVATDVYNVYKEAADKLVEKDKKEYKKLLKAKKITKEEYEGLRLGKITVGIGYNDIAEVLRKNTRKDKNPVEPDGFVPPVELSHNLYTNDSLTQYVLVQYAKENKSNGKELTIYADDYMIYDDSNFKLENLTLLENLEATTKGELDYLYYINEQNDGNLVSEIADSYGLDSECTKIIMNQNFAIIYEDKDNVIRIGDLLYNDKVNIADKTVKITDKVVMQIKIALDQISKSKRIDANKLEPKQLKIFDKAMKIEEKLDEERGISHGK